MQQTRGELTRGGKPAGVGGEKLAGTAEPVTLVDLDGAVTRIAPFGTWMREQVRHPGDEPLFITRLEEGQLWHQTGQRAQTWAHEVQVGPATIVSARGRFHAVAEPDGGATITCLEGQVAVATQLSSPLLLEPDEAVSIGADGETAVLVEPPPRHTSPPTAVNRVPRPAEGRGDLPPAPVRVWTAVTSWPYFVPVLLALVAVLLVILIIVVVFDGSGRSGAALGWHP